MADKVLAVFGDSLAQGWGVAQGRGFTDLLGPMLADAEIPARVVNHGMAGDTARMGLMRLGRVLRDEPGAAVVEFGANDWIVDETAPGMSSALDEILGELNERGASLLVCGFRPSTKLVPYVDPVRATEYEAVFKRLSRKYGAALYPDILEGVAGNPGLLQPDGLHPNEAGMSEIATRLFPFVKTLLLNS